MTSWASITSADFQDQGWFSAPNVAEVHPAYRDTRKTSTDSSDNDTSELPAYGFSQQETGQFGTPMNASADTTALALSDLKIEGGGDKIALSKPLPFPASDHQDSAQGSPKKTCTTAKYSLFPHVSSMTYTYGAPPAVAYKSSSSSSSQHSSSTHSSPKTSGHSPSSSDEFPQPARQAGSSPSRTHAYPQANAQAQAHLTPPLAQYPFSPHQLDQSRSQPGSYFQGPAPPLSPPSTATTQSPYPPRSSSCNSPPQIFQEHGSHTPMPSPGASAPIHYDPSYLATLPQQSMPYVNHVQAFYPQSPHPSLSSTTTTNTMTTTSPTGTRRSSVARSTTTSFPSSTSRLRNIFRTPVHPLIEAAKLGDAAEVARLLTPSDFIQHSPLAADKDGWTALHWAGRLGHEAVVRAALEATAAREDSGGGGAAGMRALVEARTRDHNDRTPLYLAAQNNHLGCALLLLQAGAADVNAASKMDGATALHKAAQQGHEAMVLLLLRAGADVNRKDVEGMPPVMWATQGRRLATTQLLLANGANLEIRIKLGANTELSSREGLTVLVKAVAAGNYDFARLFLAMGADPDADAPFGMRALHRAASKGHVALVRLLLEAGADHALCSEEGWTALHCAARHGHRACCEALLEAGASDAAMTGDGLIPRDLAARYGHGAIV